MQRPGSVQRYDDRQCHQRCTIPGQPLVSSMIIGVQPVALNGLFDGTGNIARTVPVGRVAIAELCPDAVLPAPIELRQSNHGNIRGPSPSRCLAIMTGVCRFL